MPSPMRQVITEPQSQIDWENLPVEFHQYMDRVDEARQNLADKEVTDSLYPTYDYDWEVDSSIAFDTILYYWNKVSCDLPDPEVLVQQIQEGMAESAYDDWVSSAYSY